MIIDNIFNKYMYNIQEYWKKNFFCLDICVVLNVVFSHSYIY